MNDLQGDKLKQFQKRRDEVLNFIRKKAKPLLRHAAELLGTKDETDNLPEKKLEQSRFTMVLVGAFQSGKSTLFNYLCDGRELSPVGIGIRTSACRVAAHPLRDGEKEHAEVTWRSGEQLVDSFGKVVRDFFEGKNLDDKKSRAELEKRAWEALVSPDISVADMEMLRLTMVVTHFYPDYQQRCREMRSTCTLAEAVNIPSYPQEWETLWEQVRHADGRMDGIFTKDMIAFAFCDGVDLYLKSENLSSLGCSIVDCPGLFASEWDSHIAEECIKKANVILYMFQGDKSMSEDDLVVLKKQLEECIRNGGRDKIIFGANLRVARTRWKEIVEKCIKPSLNKIGFDNVEVHDFHSALALRSLELDKLDKKKLCPSSRVAIEQEMEREGSFSKPYDDDKVKEYLGGMADTYTGVLVGPFQHKKLSPEFFTPLNMEIESGVPQFIQSANDAVVKKKAVNILVTNGVAPVRRALENAINSMQNQVDALSDDVMTAKGKLEKQAAKVNAFENERRSICTELDARLEKAKREITEYYKGVYSETFEKHRDHFVEAIQKHLPSAWERLFGDSADARYNKYVEAIGAQCDELMMATIDTIRKRMAGLPSVNDLREFFENKRAELLDKIQGLKGVPDMSDIAPVFPSNFEANVSSMILPTVKDQMTAVEPGYWEDLLIWTDKGEAAVIKKGFEDKIKPHIIGKLWVLFEQSFNQPEGENSEAGPLRVLDDLCSKFKKAFGAPAKKFAAEKARLEIVLNDNKEKQAAKVPAIKTLIVQATEMKKDCEELEKAIDKELSD